MFPDFNRDSMFNRFITYFMKNPFLQKDFHIHWSALTPEHIETDITKALEKTQTTINVVAARRSDPIETLTYENTIAELDEGIEQLSSAWGLVGHLDSVCNSPELRKAHNAMLPKVTDFFSSIPLNEALWETLRNFGEHNTKAGPTFLADVLFVRC